MAKQTAEPQKSGIVNMQTVGETKKGWYLTCRKGQFGFLYDFITPKGEQFTLKGNTDLVRRMTLVPEKTWCEVTLDHTEPTSKGSDMKVFKVVFDDENFYTTSSNQREPGVDDN